MTRYLALTLVLLAPAPANAAEAGSRPRLCAEDLPEGVHLSALPSCAAVHRPKPRGDGFRDVGGGLSVRMSGRVRAEYGVSR